MNSEQITAFFTGTLGVGDFDHGHCVRGWLNSELELDVRPYRYAGCPPPQQRIPACGVLPAGCPPDRGEHLGICAKVEIGGAIP